MKEKSPLSQALNQSTEARSSEESELRKPDFTNGEGIAMILSKALFPILGTMFHPSYMMANAVYSDMITPDPTQCREAGYDETDPACITGESFQAAFGLGSATMGIIMQAPVLCFSLGLSNIIP